MDSGSIRRLEQRRMLAGSAGVSAPEHILAAAFRTLRGEIRPGSRWSEPYVQETERLGVRMSERGTRITTALRDTTINGRPHWILRDSAAVEREDAWPEHSYGRAALNRITARAEPATGTDALMLLRALIRLITQGVAPPWQSGTARLRVDYHGRSNLFVIADSLPDALRAQLRDSVTLISEADWRARDLRTAGTGFYVSVRRADGFVVLNYSYSERIETPADAAPRHYAGGGQIVLMRTQTGWKEVSRSGWVT